MAFQGAAKKAQPVVLELGMQVELRADNRHIIVVLEYLLSREATFTSGQRQQEVTRYRRPPGPNKDGYGGVQPAVLATVERAA